MTEIQVRRFTGIAGLAATALVLASVPLWFVNGGGIGTELEPPTEANVLSRVLLSIGGSVALVAFLAGLRQLIIERDRRFEWIATLMLVAGVMYSTVAIVSLSLQGGIAIGSEAPIDPTQDGPLASLAFVMYSSVGRLLMALVLVAVTVAIRGTAVLPRWAGRTAVALALFNLAFVPSLYFGGNSSDFYSATGWGSTAFAASFLFYWVAAASIVLLRRKGTYAPTGNVEAAAVQSVGRT